MADNIAITAGSGTSIATEDVSSVQHQKVKVEFGGDGVATMVSASDPLPVTNASLPLPSGASTSAKQDTEITHLATLAGAVAGTEVQVDIVSGGGAGTQYTEGDTDATITGTAAMVEGAANALTPMTQPLTDTQIRATALPVSGTVTANLSATDNAVLDAIESDTTAILADTTTIAGDTTSIDAKIPALGQALAAASTPVVLTAAQITTLTPPAAITGFGTAANQTTIIGHLDGVEGLLTTIDGDTGTIATEVAGLLTDTELRATPVPVSGTVTANLGATDNAVLDAIAASTAAIETAVEGTLTVTGGGGGVEYTEGDTDASITGSALMWEDTGDTLRAVSAAKPLPISDAGGTLTVDGTVAVTNAGITTIAGAVAGTEMQVDVLTMPTTTVQATNLDIRDLTNTDVVTAELSAVDNAVLDTIAAKDFATQTTLAAINAKMVTGTDIGDVTINNSTGASAVNIQDGGNTITVDGTVTVGSITAGNNNIGDVDVASIAAGDNNIGNVDIVSGTITTVSTVTSVTAIANALPAGTNAIGKLAANSGVDIGDVDVTSIVLPRSMIGPGQPGTAIDSYTHAAISAVTGSNQSLVAAPGANKQIWVYGIGFTCSVQGTVAIQDEDDTAITGVVSYAQYSGPLVHPSGNFSMPLWKVATNKALEADVTTATINGWIDYAIVSV